MNMPTATYRIQFNPAFGFKNAPPVISYLADLGISDLEAVGGYPEGITFDGAKIWVVNQNANSVSRR